MRRKDREVTDLSEIIEILKNCDVCRLALNDDGFPYILPLNFGKVSGTCRGMVRKLRNSSL